MANFAKTHCKHGHEYTPENSGYNQGNKFCIECKRLRSKTPEHLEHMRVYGKKYRQENKLIHMEKARDSVLRTKYGITKEKFDELCKNGCEICGIKNSRFHADHNHSTGKFRGILCINCNTALGSFRDDPLLLVLATKYLLSKEQAHALAERDETV